MLNIYCYDLRGSCSRESMKSPFDDEKIYLQKKFLGQTNTFSRGNLKLRYHTAHSA